LQDSLDKSNSIAEETGKPKPGVVVYNQDTFGNSPYEDQQEKQQMEKIENQKDIFEDRPSNGLYLNHAESQYKDYEAEENVQDNVPVP